MLQLLNSPESPEHLSLPSPDRTNLAKSLLQYCPLWPVLLVPLLLWFMTAPGGWIPNLWSEIGVWEQELGNTVFLPHRWTFLVIAALLHTSYGSGSDLSCTRFCRNNSLSWGLLMIFLLRLSSTVNDIFQLSHYLHFFGQFHGT